MINYNANFESNGKKKGKEVNKHSPCPICQKPDWCLWLEKEVVICNRTTSGLKVDGWIEFAKDRDGSPIFKQKEAYEKYGQSLRKQHVKLPKKAIPTLLTSPRKDWDRTDLEKLRQEKAALCLKNFKIIPRNLGSKIQEFDPRFPVFGVESPVWEKAKKQGEEEEKYIYYHYSDCLRVIRKQWSDRRKVYQKGSRSKLIFPQHQKHEGTNWTKGKGGFSFGLYKASLAKAELEQSGRVLWIVGGEQAVEAARSMGLVATCPQGGEGKGIDEIAEFIQSSRSHLGEQLVQLLAVVPDFDIPGVNAAIRLQETLQQKFPTLPIALVNPKDLWEEMPLKGDFTDWVSILYQAIQNENTIMKNASDRIIQALGKAIDSNSQSSESSKSSEFSQEFETSTSTSAPFTSPVAAPVTSSLGKNPSIEEMIQYFVEFLEGRFLYNTVEKSWYEYEVSNPGCWGKIGREIFHHKIVTQIKEIGSYPNYRKIGIVEQELCGYFIQDKMDDLPADRIAFQNGIYNLTTQQLASHHPTNYITQTLNYSYNQEAKCPKIQRWLNQMTEGSIVKQNILLAFAAASLRKMGQLQFYLELIGAPGTGKGTWLRLMTAVLGRNNTCSTTLKNLENRFELQRLRNARFAQITDAHEFGGDPAILKTITGQDLLRIERKNKDYDNDDFYFEGVVVIAANYTPRFSCGHEALSRRRIPVLLKKATAPKDAQNLIEPSGNEWIGKFAEELPGFFNLIASIPPEQITNTLRNESSQAGKNDLLLDSDPLAQWADECLYFDPTLDQKTGLPKLKTRVGTAQKDEFGNFKNFRDSLYANYRQWLIENGHSRWISTRNFNAQLENLFQQFLGKKEVFHKRVTEGSFFFGIGFRADLPSPDAAPLIISDLEIPKDLSDYCLDLISESSESNDNYYPSEGKNIEGKKLEGELTRDKKARLL